MAGFEVFAVDCLNRDLGGFEGFMGLFGGGSLYVECFRLTNILSDTFLLEQRSARVQWIGRVGRAFRVAAGGGSHLCR